jgi:phage terminase small subunit
MTQRKKTPETADKPAVRRRTNPDREQFAHSYFANGSNGKRAAEEVGYAPGASAEVAASRLLRNERVRERIAELTAEAGQTTAPEVLGLLTSHMRGDLADLLPDDPDLRRASEAGVSHLIRKWKRTQRVVERRGDEVLIERSIEVELHDAQRAAVVLGKLTGIRDGKAPAGKAMDDFIKSIAVTPEQRRRIAEIKARRERGELPPIEVEDLQ